MLDFKSIKLIYVELVLIFGTIIPTYLRLYSYIYILVICRLTLRRLKGKRGSDVGPLTSPYRLNNYSITCDVSS
jgi:hypothetical protein